VRWLTKAAVTKGLTLLPADWGQRGYALVQERVTHSFDVTDSRVRDRLAIGVDYVARLTRVGMLEVLRQDFVRTARAKGVPERAVVARHALRLGLMPVVSYLGPAAAGLITGSLVVEQVFAIPGLGRALVHGAFDRDYTLVLGVVALKAA
jgi:oligopeptide transport system permease protein